jgi:hypothetical protein
MVAFMMEKNTTAQNMWMTAGEKMLVLGLEALIMACFVI